MARMVRISGVEYPAIDNAIEGFIGLRREWDRKTGVRKGSPWELDPKRMDDIAEEMLTPKRFAEILPKEVIRDFKRHFTENMRISEYILYNDLIPEILGKIGGDYEIEFWNTGRCQPCGKDTEHRIKDMRGPVMDHLLENDPLYFNMLSDTLRCESCGKVTDSVKSGNAYVIQGKNKYNLRLITGRIKSDARLITKTTLLCLGKVGLYRIWDTKGKINVCDSEEDCRRMAELMWKYNGCRPISNFRDFFEIHEVKDPKTKEIRYESEEYVYYLDEKGRPKKSKVHPIEARIRHGRKGREEPYKALHFPINYKGITIAVQAKTMDEWKKENDPRSPLYHRTYEQSRGVGSKPGKIQYHEGKKEAAIREKYGEFERRLERYLADSGIFNPFNPDLYVKDYLKGGLRGNLLW